MAMIGGLSVGGYSVARGQGLAKYQTILQMLKSMGAASPRAYYKEMKDQGMSIDAILAHLKGEAHPSAAAPRRARRAAAPAPRRARRVAAAPARRRVPRKRLQGAGFWGDVWDGVKEVAPVVAPFLI